MEKYSLVQHSSRETLMPKSLHSTLPHITHKAQHCSQRSSHATTLGALAPARKQSSTQACLALLWELWIQTAKFRVAAYNNCATLASLWMSVFSNKK